MVACSTTHRPSLHSGRATRHSYRPGPSLSDVRGGAALRFGHSGEDVRQIQRLLNQAGASPRLAEDGLLGPKTEAAIRRFQGQQGLPTTGALDARGLQALESAPAAPANTAGPANDDRFGRASGPARRAPQANAPAPAGTIRAGDLARQEDARRRQGSSPANPANPANPAAPVAPNAPVTPAAGQTAADARLERTQQAAVASARREFDAGVREDRGPNRGTRVDDYARDARMPVGGEWCGYFTQFNYAQAAREQGGRFNAPLHSFQKARSYFGYRSYTNNSASYNASQDALRERHAAEGSTRRFMVLDGSSGQRWAQSHGRPHETFSPSTLPIRAGDTALFNRGHVGMVESYDRSSGRLTTIEGNTAGGRVSRRTYDLNDPAVRARFEGFGRPAAGDFQG